MIVWITVWWLVNHNNYYFMHTKRLVSSYYQHSIMSLIKLHQISLTTTVSLQVWWLVNNILMRSKTFYKWFWSNCTKYHWHVSDFTNHNSLIRSVVVSVYIASCWLVSFNLQVLWLVNGILILYHILLKHNYEHLKFTTMSVVNLH